jgi:adenylate kinase family enzyme
MGCAASSNSKNVGPDPNQKNGVTHDHTKEPDSMPDLSGPKPQIIFVLGGPGSGKTLYFDRYVKEHPEFVRFSLEELLGLERDKDTPYGKEVHQLVADTKMIPATLTVKILKQAMKDAGWANKKFLLEGYPKNQKNLDVWGEVFQHRAEVKGVIYLDTSKGELEKRVNDRLPTTKRVEDQPEHFKKRLENFEKETKKNVTYFQDKGLVKTVQTERDQDAVYEDIKKNITELLSPTAAVWNNPVPEKVVQKEDAGHFIANNNPVKINTKPETPPNLFGVAEDKAGHTAGNKSAPPQGIQEEEVKKEDKENAENVAAYLMKKKTENIDKAPKSIEELAVVDDL